MKIQDISGVKDTLNLKKSGVGERKIKQMKSEEKNGSVNFDRSWEKVR